MTLEVTDHKGKVGPAATAFLVYHAVKATVIVLTDPPWNIIQCRIFVSLARMQTGE